MFLLLMLATSPSSVGAENTTCPVMPGTAIDPAFFVDHEGERIYFCCDRCVMKFGTNPAFYVASMRVEAEAAARRAGQDEAWPRIVRFLGKLHPIAVHFPIAFALSALLCEIFVAMADARELRSITRFLLFAAALSALVAAPLGWAAAWNQGFGSALEEAVFRHRWLGVASTVAIVLAFLARERAERPGTAGSAVGAKVWLPLLVIAALSIAVGSFYGGILVRGPGHLAF
jgi:uncharacterized membrane protein/YHS domain-containing protein